MVIGHFEKFRSPLKVLDEISYEVQPLNTDRQPLIRALLKEISARQYQATIRVWHGRAKIFFPFDKANKPVSVPIQGYSMFFPQGYVQFAFEIENGKLRIRVDLFEVYWRYQVTTWGFSIAKKFIELCRAVALSSIVMVISPHEDIRCKWNRNEIKRNGRTRLEEFYLKLGFRRVGVTEAWELGLN